MNVVTTITNLQKLTNGQIVESDIARAISMERGNLSRKKREGTPFNQKQIEAIEEYFNVSFNNLNDSKTISGESCVSADYYPDVFGSCRNGTFTLSERKERLQLPGILFKRYSKSKQYSVINAGGDSMTPLYTGQRQVDSRTVGRRTFAMKMNFSSRGWRKILILL